MRAETTLCLESVPLHVRTECAYSHQGHGKSSTPSSAFRHKASGIGGSYLPNFLWARGQPLTLDIFSGSTSIVSYTGIMKFEKTNLLKNRFNEWQPSCHMSRDDPFTRISKIIETLDFSQKLTVSTKIDRIHVKVLCDAERLRSQAKFIVSPCNALLGMVKRSSPWIHPCTLGPLAGELPEIKEPFHLFIGMILHSSNDILPGKLNIGLMFRIPPTSCSQCTRSDL